MNKRKRKKQIRKTLRELVTVYNKLEAIRERVFNEALQDLLDAYKESPERRDAAMRRFMEISLRLAHCSPPSMFVTKMCNPTSTSPHN